MKNQNAVKWRVENSWGDKGGNKGYHIMTDKWFDEYNYEIVVHKDYISDELNEIFESGEAIPLKTMGSYGRISKINGYFKSCAVGGSGLFGYRGHWKLAIFFGAMPDLVSFGVLFVVRFFSGSLKYGGLPTLESLKQLEPFPDWLFFMDNLSHSFFNSFY